MIVRMHDKLANIILGTQNEDDPIVENSPSPIAVWDGKELIRQAPPKLQDISHLVSYVPDWLMEMVPIGTTMFVDSIEFAELDYELQQHFDIIKY